MNTTAGYGTVRGTKKKEKLVREIQKLRKQLDVEHSVFADAERMVEMAANDVDVEKVGLQGDLATSQHQQDQAKAKEDERTGTMEALEVLKADFKAAKAERESLDRSLRKEEREMQARREALSKLRKQEEDAKRDLDKEKDRLRQLKLELQEMRQKEAVRVEHDRRLAAQYPNRQQDKQMSAVSANLMALEEQRDKLEVELQQIRDATRRSTMQDELAALQSQIDDAEGMLMRLGRRLHEDASQYRIKTRLLVDGSDVHPDEDEVHVFSVTPQVSFPDLTAMVNDAYERPMTLKFRDEDDEAVTIASASDLATALAQCRGNTYPTYVPLYVVNGPCAGAATTPSSGLWKRKSN